MVAELTRLARQADKLDKFGFCFYQEILPRLASNFVILTFHRITVALF